MATLNQTIQDNTAVSNKLTAEVAEFYSKTLLSRLIPELRFAKYASKPSMTKIPKRAGDKISFRRINSLALVTSALTEGVTPDGQNLSISKIDTTVVQYGGWVSITDLVDMVALDPIITETAEVLGEQAGQSIEKIIADVIFAGSEVLYAGAEAARADVATTISAADILAATAMLKKANVKPLEGGDYVAFVPIKVAHDIMQLDEWVTANTYRHDGLVQGEIGKLYGVRFIEVPENFATVYEDAAGTGTLDVYASLFIGKDYFGIADVEGSAKPEMIVKPLGSGDDPLNQRATVGWKTLFSVKRMNESCGVRLETL
ncbi:MAG: N4-gp56 family major capsid protein [Negativicutes bacterium]|nr:N4-gp56 family major capsid protein [Negativicutes bacterium]